MRAEEITGETQAVSLTSKLLLHGRSVGKIMVVALVDVVNPHRLLQSSSGSAISLSPFVIVPRISPPESDSPEHQHSLELWSTAHHDRLFLLHI